MTLVQNVEKKEKYYIKIYNFNILKKQNFNKEKPHKKIKKNRKNEAKWGL